ncbi:RagB/SusD family nutrient uptake outer membrane protein [Algoriphagus namhaensis]
MKNISKRLKSTAFRLLGLMGIAAILCGCEEFLDVKPDQSLVVPTTLDDVRGLLDNTNVFNVQPVLPLISAEEMWISDQGFDALTNPIEQATYTWQEDPFLGGFGGDWVNPYRQVFYANVALEALEKYQGSDLETYETLLGSALFLRAYAYSQLAVQFAPPYQKNGGNEGLLGIVLKETADINQAITRSSLQETYNKIISDLLRAVDLLPIRNEPKTRPSKAAALGLLARVYLSTFQYELAAKASIQALSSYPERLNWNDLNVNAPRPFTRFDSETVFYSVLASLTFPISNEVVVDSVLLDQFEVNDLRLPSFFDARPDGLSVYTGKISGDTRNFGGISVGELYLNAMEGLARTGQNEQALQLLNEFLSLRYESSSWMPIDQLDNEELISRILEERRKELIGRGIRWSDLRRLNQEEAPVTLRRIVKGQSFELLPNSLRYTFPIPIDEINQSGITQNPR